MKKFTKSSLKSGDLIVYRDGAFEVMVQWTDDEPWKIEDLLKLDVKKDG